MDFITVENNEREHLSEKTLALTTMERDIKTGRLQIQTGTMEAI